MKIGFQSLVILIPLFFFVFQGLGQVSETDRKTVLDLFQEKYNADDYTYIFNMFSSELQNELTLEKTKEFLKSIKAQVGQMEKNEFLGMESNSFAAFKSFFEKGVLKMNISIDNRNLINGFFVKPFIETSNNEEQQQLAIKLTKSCTDIPDKQIQLITEKCKNFPLNSELSIAIINNGISKFIGVKITEDTLLIYDNSHKAFEIGSITKVFTSTILASLVLDKTIKLDQPIKSLLKTRKKDIRKITFKQLSNHTSGFPRLPTNLMSSAVNVSNPYQHYNEKHLLEYLNNPIKLSNLPGEAFEYSNTGAGILAYLLSIASSKDYHQLLDEIVFTKYNMTVSTYDRNNLSAELVDGLGALGEKVPHWDFASMEGAGGIISTTKELSKFAFAQFDTSNLDLTLTRKSTFNIDHRRSVGLGWLIMKEDTGEERFWHNGGTGGFSSSMILEVESKNAIIILSNVSPFNQHSNNIDALCFGLIDLI